MDYGYENENNCGITRARSWIYSARSVKPFSVSIVSSVVGVMVTALIFSEPSWIDPPGHVVGKRSNCKSGLTTTLSGLELMEPARKPAVDTGCLNSNTTVQKNTF